ncbi:MAG: hypothetical protein HY297_04375 [Thaumarchaeota archaeon]|nr:hypothetical protein [Nitrososphaerota archaeon]
MDRASLLAPARSFVKIYSAVETAMTRAPAARSGYASGDTHLQFTFEGQLVRHPWRKPVPLMNAPMIIPKAAAFWIVEFSGNP